MKTTKSKKPARPSCNTCPLVEIIKGQIADRENKMKFLCEPKKIGYGLLFPN